jgi:hypothetical protein
MDIVDEALRVVTDDQRDDCIDRLSDFHCMPEETSVVGLDLRSTKGTAKKYSCNKEGDFFENWTRRNLGRPSTYVQSHACSLTATY